MTDHGVDQGAAAEANSGGYRQGGDHQQPVETVMTGRNWNAVSECVRKDNKPSSGAPTRTAKPQPHLPPGVPPDW